jgi:hypothetical protein
MRQSRRVLPTQRLAPCCLFALAETYLNRSFRVSPRADSSLVSARSSSTPLPSCRSAPRRAIVSTSNPGRAILGWKSNPKRAVKWSLPALRGRAASGSRSPTILAIWSSTGGRRSTDLRESIRQAVRGRSWFRQRQEPARITRNVMSLPGPAATRDAPATAPQGLGWPSTPELPRRSSRGQGCSLRRGRYAIL